jgi:hypothetical protein
MNEQGAIRIGRRERFNLIEREARIAREQHARR